MTGPALKQGLRIAVTGGRDFTDHQLIRRVLTEELRPSCVLVGDCPTGVDRYVRIVAVGSGIACAVWQAAWVKYGNPAGPIRNGSMLRHGNPELLVAFQGGKGTADCVRQAVSLGIPVHHVT